MVTEGTKGPQFSADMATRKIHVQKFAESRAYELESLQSVIADRIKGDYRSQRNKRRRTSSYNSKAGTRRKRQKLGTVHNKTGGVELRLGKDEIKKLPSRRMRRRYELKMNLDSGFCTSGDGTKRLRTHVWHTKRFTMTKLWGYYLPLALQGRGKGSRALLKRLKQGVVVHDASYYTAVQVEGPEESLASLLRMVLVPFPETSSQDSDESVSGTTCGMAMLYQVEAPVSQPIGPVTYMWRPTFQQNISGEDDINDELMKHDVDSDESPNRMKLGASFRQLWVWIHASAFEEGYDSLKFACQKEMEKTGISINCFSLEGELAKLEVIGSGAIQILQKMLHPVTSISDNHCLWEHVPTQDSVSQKTSSSISDNEDKFSSVAILSLNVKDPRQLCGKGTVSSVEPSSAEAVNGAQETIHEELEKTSDLASSTWSKLENNQYHNNDLWYAKSRRLRTPLSESMICSEKHHKRLTHYCLDDVDSREANSLTEEQCSRSCPILLVKHHRKELFRGCSIILPLSWVKAFWIPLISNGAHAIGLQEMHCIAHEMGLPAFPSDFPDCKAYSCFMSAKAAAFDKKAELRPPSKRPMRVPILPPWGIIRSTLNRKINAVETTDVSTLEDLTDLNSLPKKIDSENSLFDGIVARTGSVLTNFLNETKGGQLSLFPYAADGDEKITKFIKGEVNLNRSCQNSVISDHRLCFLRVHLRPFKKGFFEEGAVICAPHPSDTYLLTSCIEKNEGFQLPQSALESYFKEDHSSKRWEMHVPDDSNAKEYHRWPIGFVTSAAIQGSKRLVAGGFCEAVLLANLREEQWKEMPAKRRKKDIYVLVRNLRSVAYRLALASVVLEYQENDTHFM
ncbi:ribonucleases P/MRP protein subunit POP1 [Arachis stenosperma]|uniref:ribonucleases P/MRP protein subunit POP1 n=1 Tax=Arachis stenosperma TaxID=217475 RepID=UPI0025ACFCFA|nr:ribonucleases P/MRP protein subunit POP1 [Arachis stenosperma]XP_057719743.1 ribonucleases P/MRP protein subunit POP1 [Arachis stenosperma]XP_057719744.1 ribonucleases P/MRP protein subunit POP1 [Arachis stenosperma]XP_057719745.1 ribonucleases P/MRP protein subunit POP1 [Arachis stenosperma]XP_057719746.1 ribonucleases P/MRP protein subunit POP1 [Arachis stenosperma]XP_057719747.1 ribonucleases P/MRP protein subunit POP1 [Arachis stenosperma]XP_057719748.1 ribonucleases P/MRP protein subu